jgi:riboflavin synthase alpha subunit
MFTGIVQEPGLVRSVRPSAPTIDIPAAIRDGIEFGHCVPFQDVYLSEREGSLSACSADLERPAPPNCGLDAQLILGHGGSLKHAKATYPEDAGSAPTLEFHAQDRRFIADRRAIVVEGISLTPYDSDSGSFHCAIIPDPCEQKVLKDRRRERAVNDEFDTQGKSVERMIRFVHSD